MLGIRIREARFAAGLTQAALARAAGVSERNIVRWENDHHAPRFEHVAAIAEATGKDVDFFTNVAAVADGDPDDEESDLADFLIFALRSYRKTKVERPEVKL